MSQFLESDVLRMLDLFSRKRSVEALTLARSLAVQGEPTALEYLGHAYSEGVGVPKSIKAGTLWYRRAWSESRQSHLCINIAVNYANSGNHRRARFWYQRAISLGDGDAAIEFAEYLLGRGVSPASDEVRRLISVALDGKQIFEDGLNRAHCLGQVRAR